MFDRIVDGMCVVGFVCGVTSLILFIVNGGC